VTTLLPINDPHVTLLKPSDACQYGNDILIADAGNHCIRKFSRNGTVTSFAGNCSTTAAGFRDGLAATAQFSQPCALGVTKQGDVFVSDYDNNCIRRISSGGIVTTFAGLCGWTADLAASENYVLDGVGTNARFKQPQGLVVDGNEDTFILYIADSSFNAIRVVFQDGTVMTLAGLLPSTNLPFTVGLQDAAGTNARFNFPIGLAIQLGTGAERRLLISDSYNNRIRVASWSGFRSEPCPKGELKLLFNYHFLVFWFAQGVISSHIFFGRLLLSQFNLLPSCLSNWEILPINGSIGRE
jgi:hypothetical protein